MPILSIFPLATLNAIQVVLTKLADSYGKLQVVYFPILYILRVPLQSFYYGIILWIDYFFTTWCAIGYTIMFPIFLILSQTEKWDLAKVPYSPELYEIGLESF